MVLHHPPQVTAGPRCVCPCSTRSPLLVTRLMTIKQGFRHYASVRSSLGGGRLHQTSQQCAAAPRCQGVALTLSLFATFCPLIPPLLEHAGVEGRLPRHSRHFLRGGNAPDWIKSRRRMRVLPRSTPWREDIGCCVLWAAHEATLRVGKRKGKPTIATRCRASVVPTSLCDTKAAILLPLSSLFPTSNKKLRKLR